MLKSIFSTDTALASITSIQFFECMLASLVLGILIALIYMFKNSYNKNFVITLALLPAVVQLVIMLVNGNLGAGVAVMGAFSLIRFRSVPGSARDIGSIFTAMAVGLATGMGYIFLALIFLIAMAVMNVLFHLTKFGGANEKRKQLSITIPESLDYTGIFDDVLNQYTKSSQLTRVKTTNMGTMFELTYLIQLNENDEEKKFIDELRCRNGNLKIVCGMVPENKEMM